MSAVSNMLTTLSTVDTNGIIGTYGKFLLCSCFTIAFVPTLFHLLKTLFSQKGD